MRPLNGGRNHSVHLLTNGEEDLCIKVFQPDKDRQARNEWNVLNLLHESGISIIPKPIRLIEDSECFVLVMGYLQGTRMDKGSLTNVELASFGDSLEIIYSLSSENPAYPTGSVNGSPTYILDRVRHFFGSAVPGIALQPNLETWKMAKSWVFSQETRELLASQERIFSRGDPNLSNCLWDGSKVCFVDFEYAGWTDKIFDLADLLEHVNSRGISDELWMGFIDRFELDNQQLKRLGASRKLFSLYWSAKLWPMEYGNKEADNRFMEQLHRAANLLA